jgi:hypothetical protein
VDRAHQQAREARRKAKPRSTRGSESNENTMRQADIMDWVLDRLGELEGRSKPPHRRRPSDPAHRSFLPIPTPDQLREAIAQPHVSTFGDLWAEFPDASGSPAPKGPLGPGGSRRGGAHHRRRNRLSAEEEVAFVEEVQSIDGVPVKRRARATGKLEEGHRDRFARTKVVRVRSHNRSRGARNQAKRDGRGKGRS